MPPPVWGRRPLPPHKGAGSNRPPTSVPVTNAPLKPSRDKQTQPRPSPPVGSQGFEVGVLVGGDVAQGRVVCVYVCEHVRMSLKGRQPTRPYLVQ